MTEKNEQVATREQEAQEVRPQREPETVFVPEVDIYEDNDTIRLVADVPGVDQQSVSVTVENNVLTLEGTAQVDVPEGYELIGQEYGIGRFRRDFTLSDRVNTDAIKARVRQGTLELSVPKREEVKTRKVEVSG